jgi:hypothetical protein
MLKSSLRFSRALVIFPLLLIAACASTPTKQVEQTALTPLSDLNLVRAEIPPILQDAVRDPYAEPQVVTCPVIASAIEALDAVLGADLDVPAPDGKPSMSDRGSEAAGNAALGALRRTAEGVVPFRSWVRKLTGAETLARETAAAVVAGSIRRAYLKGLGQAIGCASPAAPRMTK